MLRITHYGERVLTQKGAEVTVFDDALMELADAMVKTMYEADGIGLAAQQVGQAIRLCVVDVAFEGVEVDFFHELDGKTPPIDLIMPMALVNPCIEFISQETDLMEEGCLSFPGIRGEVRRPSAIDVRYQDLEGQFHRLKCDGILARCIQHEVDHLNGILFTERMDSRIRKALKSDLKQLKEATLSRDPSALS